MYLYGKMAQSMIITNACCSSTYLNRMSRYHWFRNDVRLLPHVKLKQIEKQLLVKFHQHLSSLTPWTVKLKVVTFKTDGCRSSFFAKKTRLAPRRIFWWLLRPPNPQRSCIMLTISGNILVYVQHIKTICHDCRLIWKHSIRAIWIFKLYLQNVWICARLRCVLNGYFYQKNEVCQFAYMMKTEIFDSNIQPLWRYSCDIWIDGM